MNDQPSFNLPPAPAGPQPVSSNEPGSASVQPMMPAGQSIAPSAFQSVPQSTVQSASQSTPQSTQQPTPQPAPAMTNIPTVTPARQPWEVIFAVLTVFISLIGAFMLYFLNVSTTSQIKQAEATIARLTTEISSPPLAETDKQLTVINSTLRGYKAALAKRADLTQFYEQLTYLTPPTIKLRTVAVTEKGQVSITARANNFIEAGQALLSFRQSSLLSQVAIVNIGLSNHPGSEQGVIFDLSALLKKSVPAATPSPTEPKP